LLYSIHNNDIDNDRDNSNDIVDKEEDEEDEENKYINTINGRPVIFYTHTIILIKSISSLSKSKSNNNKKSDRRLRKKKTNTTYVLYALTITIVSASLIRDIPWTRRQRRRSRCVPDQSIHW